MRVLLRGGDVVDGRGGPRLRADVLVDGDRIAAVGPDLPVRGADRVIDAGGLVVTPGFIDMHAHSDLAVLTDPAHVAKLAQGVTTEVLGQDGLSYAPVGVGASVGPAPVGVGVSVGSAPVGVGASVGSAPVGVGVSVGSAPVGVGASVGSAPVGVGAPAGPAPVDDFVLAALRQQIAGWNGDPVGLVWDWRTVGEYLDRIDRGSPVNVAYLVPHGTLRMVCVGHDDRPATERELSAMRALLAAGLRDGAFGLSSGLTYPPGMYAPTAELAALCRVLAAYGGYHGTHHRSYGAGALDAYAEVIAVAAHTGSAVHLTHATMNFPVNAGRAVNLLSMVDDARARGVDVTMDSYPYLAGATTLAALLPSWAAAGGPSALAARLADPATRARIADDMEVTGSDGCHGVPIDWSAITISGSRDASAVGRSVAEIAAATGTAPSDACFDLLRADDLGTSCLMHVGHEANVRAILRHPAHLVGSDGILIGARPHPRGWGTFPRYLAEYVRRTGLLTLEECVAKMTGRAADRLGLRGRGRVAAGQAADLVALDPDTVADRATYDEPRRAPDGIPYVLVNGVVAIDGGTRTAAVPGRSLRRGAA